MLFFLCWCNVADLVAGFVVIAAVAVVSAAVVSASVAAVVAAAAVAAAAAEKLAALSWSRPGSKIPLSQQLLEVALLVQGERIMIFSSFEILWDRPQGQSR